MEPVKNPVSGYPDTVIGAPPGHEETIMPLPAAMGEHHSGAPLIVSRWHPTEEERKAISEGGDVYLALFSPVMVPVMLTTEQPLAAHRVAGDQVVILTPDHPDYSALAALPGVGG